MNGTYENIPYVAFQVLGFQDEIICVCVYSPSFKNIYSEKMRGETSNKHIAVFGL